MNQGHYGYFQISRSPEKNHITDLNKFVDACLKFQNRSLSKDKQVASLLVKDDSILYRAHNHDLIDVLGPCEDENNVCFSSVTHAEESCLLNNCKAYNFEDVQNLSMFVTHIPCWNCARMIVQSGIVSSLYIVLLDERKEYLSRLFEKTNNMCLMDIFKAYNINVNIVFKKEKTFESPVVDMDWLLNYNIKVSREVRLLDYELL